MLSIRVIDHALYISISYSNHEPALQADPQQREYYYKMKIVLPKAFSTKHYKTELLTVQIRSTMITQVATKPKTTATTF